VEKSKFVLHLQWYEGRDGAVAETIRALGEAVGRKPVASALGFVMEVKVETALVAGSRGTNGYMIALICVILLIAMCGAIALYLYCKRLRRDAVSSTTTLRDTCSRNHEDEKSNNLQNEENLRRYANPIRDENLSSMSLGGSLASLSSTRHVKAALKPATSSVDLVSHSTYLIVVL